MRVEIKTVDPAAMRYPTAGDWEWLPDGALLLKIPEYGGRDVSVLLVAIHEMIEAYLCKRDGITDEQVTKFDTDNPKLEEPGDDPAAPYHRQHVVAMALEREAASTTELEPPTETVTGGATDGEALLASEPPDFQAMTKAQIVDYCSAVHGVELDSSQTKAELIEQATAHEVQANDTAAADLAALELGDALL